tara:strand:+ start:740 stop:955 length:216 start_codon:yes stop_codon:yes gene_type:complete
MGELKIIIPDDKIQLVADAFADIRGTKSTMEAVKQDITNDVKSVVKRHKLKRMETGQDIELRAADMTVDIK